MLHYTRLARLARDKPSSLLGPYESYKRKCIEMNTVAGVYILSVIYPSLSQDILSADLQTILYKLIIINDASRTISELMPQVGASLTVVN